MKYLLFLIGLVAACIVGYSFEPQMRHLLTGMNPGEMRTVAPAPAPVAVAVAVEAAPEPNGIDPASFPADRLPEKILLNAEAEIADAASGITMKIPAGSRVNLIRLDGPNVIISPGAGAFEGSVPIVRTDLLEQLAALPKNPTPPPVGEVPMPDEPVAPPDVQPEPTPEQTPEPEEPLAAEPTPEPEPTPAPTSEPAIPSPAGSGDVVAVMKGSIQAGEIKEFTFDQVLDWQAGEGSETIDGETYQTGMASYKAETVFGVKTIQAKALIQGGKVVRWLWPKSGMEIK